MIIIVQLLWLALGFLIMVRVNERIGVAMLGASVGFAVAVLVAGGTWERLIS